MRTLVTGACGFIGSNLCRRLSEQSEEGDIIVAVDSFVTSLPQNIRAVRSLPRVVLQHYDVREPFENGLMSACHRVYHLACPASPAAYYRDPIGTLETSVYGTRNVLQLSVDGGYDHRIVFTSTSEVYGEPAVHPQTESYHGNVNPLGPRACYDEGKRAAETLCVDFIRKYAADVRIVRLFNCYGPGMAIDDGRVVPAFFKAALTGKAMPMNGGGNQTRSLCYVDDMVSGLIKSMEAPESTIGPINLGNPEEVTIRNLGLAIADVAGVPFVWDNAPALLNDPSRRCPDILRAKEWLGWEPTFPLREGLARTLEWFRGILVA